MSQTTARIIRQSEARNFMEGPEHCREYVKTARLWFGTSSLPVGERGANTTRRARVSPTSGAASGR